LGGDRLSGFLHHHRRADVATSSVTFYTVFVIDLASRRVQIFTSITNGSLTPSRLGHAQAIDSIAHRLCWLV
jgi:hypothetical protein